TVSYILSLHDALPICIERLVQSLKNVKNQEYVATSDYLEQRTIFSRGALRKSARELLIEINDMDTNIKGQMEQQNKENPKITVLDRKSTRLNSSHVSI